MGYTTIKGFGGPTLVSDAGLSEDKYGLTTGQARWWGLNTAVVGTVGLLGSTHPAYPALVCERRVISDAPAGYFVDAFYCGIMGSPSPLYELDTCVTQAPIETHPDFATFAGTAASPQNGALFNEDESFNKFGADAPDAWRGVTAYELPVAVVRKTQVSTDVPNADIVGTISTPGNTFSVSATNWLVTSISSEKRGAVYVTRTEWRASGPNGWNSSIY